MKSNSLPCVVSIAGTDPSGGAGIQADIKAISATGAYAASIITALVSQNTQGVQATANITTNFLRQQFISVFTDLEVQAVKIGMLQEARVIDVVFSELQKFIPKWIVLDPVMIAKGGAVLLDLQTIKHLKTRVKGAVHLITPNLFETEQLLGTTIKSFPEMERAATMLAEELEVDVLIKGGHMLSEKASDVLYIRQEHEHHWFHSERIHTKNTHGTGCSLSSAIASYLAQDYGLSEAVAAAKSYLTKATQSGARYHIGQGNGPIDHFYFLDNR